MIVSDCSNQNITHLQKPNLMRGETLHICDNPLVNHNTTEIDVIIKKIVDKLIINFDIAFGHFDPFYLPSRAYSIVSLYIAHPLMYLMGFFFRTPNATDDHVL